MSDDRKKSLGQKIGLRSDSPDGVVIDALCDIAAALDTLGPNQKFRIASAGARLESKGVTAILVSQFVTLLGDGT